MKKPKYHIRNWSEYNSSLKQRGSLTIWVSPETVENWMMDELTGQLGASPTYTDLAIETGRSSGHLRVLRQNSIHMRFQQLSLIFLPTKIFEIKIRSLRRGIVNNGKLTVNTGYP